MAHVVSSSGVTLRRSRSDPCSAPVRWLLLAAITTGLIVGGCGSDDDPEAMDSLTITLEDLTLSPPRVESRLLECNPPGGGLPDAAEACERLATRSMPFAEPPKDEVCAQIFGGPETLTVTGSFAGERVDRTFSRSNSCEIDRFDQMAATFGITDLIG